MNDASDYTKSTTAILTILLNNYDVHSEDPEDQKMMEFAKEWEGAFLDYIMDISTHETIMKWVYKNFII